MLFHVIAKHDYETCPGVLYGPESDEVNELTKWVEGDENVNVLGFGLTTFHILLMRCWKLHI